MSGRIVLLNGPSSAGKSTLAAALVELLPTPWHVFPVDAVHAMRSRPDLRGVTGIEWETVFRRSRAGYHRALAAGGCDVVGDHVLSEPWRLTDLLTVTEGLDVLLVHVTCDVDELERREVERGDRDLGAARQQLAVVFAHGDCDLVVDTTSLSPIVCAEAVAALIQKPPADRAFNRLRPRESPVIGPPR